MSSQPTQRVRRNASPSTSKQGPMKATMQFGLVPRQGSPSRNNRKGSPSSSPVPVWVPESHRIKTRRSPDNRASPERRSPSSPLAHKVEKPKPVRPSPSNPIRRTGSLDTIAGPYLTGQWPKDALYTASFTNDNGQLVAEKSTQTSEDFVSDSRSKKQQQQQQQQHIRSASLGNGDNLKELYKQRMNRAKEGSKQQESSKLRQSPVHGNHLALGQVAIVASSGPIKIPGSHIPKGIVRTRNSVEGLNPEIEKLVLKNITIVADEDRGQESAPDGHRAPVAELLNTRRSVDTQTPAANEDYSRTPEDNNSSGSGSRSQSISPSFPIIPGNMDTSRPSSRSDSSDSASKEVEIKVEKDLDTSISPDCPLMSKYSASPKPNKSYDFVRSPPDGCERVKIIDEASLKKPTLKGPLYSITPSGNQFKLSERSAFCPMSQYTTCLATTPAILSPVPAASHAGIESL